MPDRRAAELLIARLAEQLGAEGMALDESGRLTLRLDAVEVEVACDEEDAALWLVSAAPPTPRLDRAAALLRLLDANHLAAPGAPGFAVDGVTGAVVVLTEILESELDHGQLEARLLAHVATVESGVDAPGESRIARPPDAIWG